MKEHLDFLCVGATKAGTTTLHHALAQHPQIYLPKVKETYFFSSDRDYLRGYKWYLDTYFSGVDERKFWGEITPSYLYHAKKVVKRLKAQKMEQVKIIAIFRDPVQRAYSHYWMIVNNGKEPLSFQNALEREEARIMENPDWIEKAGRTRYTYFQSGLYAEKIKYFLDEFPQDQILLLLFEDLVTDYDGTMLRLQEFIGIEPFLLKHEHRNQAKRYKSHLLRSFHHISPNIKKLAKKYLSHNLSRQYKNHLENKGIESFQYPPLNSSIENRLREKYAKDIETLSRLIKQDLSAWLPK